MWCLGPNKSENLTRLCASTLAPQPSKLKIQSKDDACNLISLIIDPLFPLPPFWISPITYLASEAMTNRWRWRSAANANASLHAMDSYIVGSSTPPMTSAVLPRTVTSLSLHNVVACSSYSLSNTNIDVYLCIAHWRGLWTLGCSEWNGGPPLHRWCRHFLDHLKPVNNMLMKLEECPCVATGPH